MKKTIQKTIFECDRCKSTNERNINEITGILIQLDVTKTVDMRYGNSVKETVDLCQKCSNDFDWYMKEKTNLCDMCKYDFPTCNAEHITFGTGVGNDNIAVCDEYRIEEIKCI